MDFKIGGPSKTSSVDKPKKKTGVNKTGGPSFADALKESSATSEAQETTATTPVRGVVDAPFYPPPEEIPTNPQDRGQYILEQLEALEQDILAGHPTQAVERLRRALVAAPLDMQNLTDKQKAILDALELRAAVEVAKIEAENSE